MSSLFQQPWWSALRGQWSTQRRLRWGVLFIAGLLWIQGLLVLGDRVQVLRQDAESLREDIQRLQTQASNKVWPGRADDARQQVAALRSMLWQEGDIGLAEAAAQDRVRALATKYGLGVRELAVARAAAPVAGPSAASAAQRVAGAQPVRLRLTVDLNRLALMGLLAELAQHEQVIVVERLFLRTASQPPTAELDLRMLAAVKAEPK